MPEDLTARDASSAPSAEHPVLELTWTVHSTHRQRFELSSWGEDFADWFSLSTEDGSEQLTEPTAEQVHTALVETRHLPEMFRDHLIQDATEHNGIDWDMDDADLNVRWVARRGGAR